MGKKETFRKSLNESYEEFWQDFQALPTGRTRFYVSEQQKHESSAENFYEEKLQNNENDGYLILMHA